MTYYRQSHLKAILVLASVLSLASCAKRDTRLNKGSTFYVDTVTATFTADELNPNDVVNRKFANFTACIKDNALSSAVMNLEFQIAAGDVAVTKKTDDRGCLMWQEFFSYNPYEDEKQIQMARSITALRGHSGTEVVQLAYDPWDGDRVIFLKREAARGADPVSISYAAGGQVTRRDLVSGRNYTIPIDIRTTIISQSLKQSFISDMTLEFLKRDFNQYEINPALSLTIAHQYRMKFSSALVRRTLSLGTVTQNISAGQFKIYFVLLKEGFDRQQLSPQNLAPYIVSASEMNTTASLGRFIADVTLRFRDMAALASRMTGVLTIVSLDQPNNFAETSFEGLVNPIAGGDRHGVDLIPSKMNARELLEVDKATQADRARQTGTEFFAKNSGYVEMSRDPVVIKRTSAILGRPIQETVDLFGAFKNKKPGQALSYYELQSYGRALCDRLFNGQVDAATQKAYNQCLYQPDKMVTTTVRDFVDRINSPVPRKVGIPQVETLTMSAGFELSHVKSTSWGHNYSANAGVSASAGGGASAGVKNLLGGSGEASIGAKISLGGEWFYNNGVTHSTNDSTKVSVDRSQSISSEGFKFAFDAIVRTCYLISPTPLLLQAVGQAAKVQGRYFCSDQVQNQTREETYYFLNQATGLSSSPLSDNISSEDNPWRMFIRGYPSYSLFAEMLAKKGVKLVLEKIPDDAVMKQFNEFYVTQEYPGMLTP